MWTVERWSRRPRAHRQWRVHQAGARQELAGDESSILAGARGAWGELAGSGGSIITIRLQLPPIASTEALPALIGEGRASGKRKRDEELSYPVVMYSLWEQLRAGWAGGSQPCAGWLLKVYTYGEGQGLLAYYKG